jgi:hypothetical protein
MGLWDEGEGASHRVWGAWSSRRTGGGRFGRRNRKLSRMGSISVGPRENPLLMAAGGVGCGRGGQLQAWGAWSPRCTGGLVWQAKPKITPYGLDIGGTWGKPPANGSRGSWDVGEGASCGPGGPGARDAQGGRFGAENRESRRSGSISLGRAGNHQQIVLGTCRVRVRPSLKGLGVWNPVCARVGGFSARYRTSSA